MRTGDRPVPPSPGISARPNISSPISFGGFGSSSASSPGSHTSLNLGAGVPSTVPRRLLRVERSVRNTTRGATNVLLDRFNGFRNAAAPSIPSPILESPQQYTSFTGTPVFGTGVDPDNMEATVADIIYDSVYGDATDSAPTSPISEWFEYDLTRVHRIPDPKPVRTKGGRRATSKKHSALRATPAGADDRLALRQWLFHPLLTQARLRHPTFCP